MAKRALRALTVLWFCASSGACSTETEDPATAGPATGNEDPADDDLGEPFPPEDRTARPSAGCGVGSASPPVGGQMLVTGGQAGTYLITIPSNYDPSAPYPLAFVFHGANNTENACRAGGNCAGVSAALEIDSIVVYMKSFGTSWTDGQRDQNVIFFDDLLAHVKGSYCVDGRRVYALGTSSGAHFSNILACRRGDDLLAIVPGAGERLETSGCVGRVAALVLHGIDDISVPFAKGEQARDAYALQNGCTSETVPALTTMHDEVRAARDANISTYRCVDYQGCREGLPVRWCEHSEPGYDGSTHGWPAAGGPLAWDFVREL